MSVDKLVDSTQLDSDLTSVANAIRTKGGTSAALAFPADFVSAIAAIPSGGGIPTIDLTDEQWEIGAVGGNTGRTYVENKTTNANRLRLVNLLPLTNSNGRYIIIGDFGTEWQGQYALYDADGISTAQFVVFSSPCEIPYSPNIALVFRHVNGNLPMYVNDIETIHPYLIDISSIVSADSLSNALNRAEAYDILMGVTE